MGGVFGEIFPLAVAAALSPIPIIGVTLMLATPRGVGNAFAFLAGWAVGVMLAGSIVLLLAGDSISPAAEGSKIWSGWLTIVLGLILLWFARKQFVARPKPGSEPALPRWTNSIDRFDAPRAAALGFALSAVNPKNLLLIVGAAALIAQSTIAVGDKFTVLAAFALVSLLGPALPLAIYYLAGDGAARRLASVKSWLAHNNSTVITVLCVIIAAKLIGSGITTLAG